MKHRWTAQSVVIAALALLFLPAILYMLRIPVALLLLMILISLCPCISSECVNCSCDACVYRVLIVVLSVLVIVPTVWYLMRRRLRLR